MTLCSTCNDREARVKGKCQRCYQREYDARKRAEKQRQRSRENDPMELRNDSKQRLILAHRAGMPIDDLCWIVSNCPGPWLTRLMNMWIFGKAKPGITDARRIISRIDEDGQLIPTSA